jgi:hypothetical protein
MPPLLPLLLIETNIVLGPNTSPSNGIIFATKSKKGWLDVHKVNPKDNWADIFTKLLPHPQFCILRAAMMGWTPHLK